ncbi:MAG: hypothetical protein NPIRA03_15860 [Nitrospirales bacterium]|nr:MAG: hypothetical protein NPIRA03_15860 [Nitrospirales bacterium]
MDKFDETAQQQKFLLKISTESSTENQEQGADAFSSAGKDVTSDGIDERGMRFKVCGNLAFNLNEVRPKGLPHILHGLQISKGWFLMHGGDTRGSSVDCQAEPSLGNP